MDCSEQPDLVGQSRYSRHVKCITAQRDTPPIKSKNVRTYSIPFLQDAMIQFMQGCWPRYLLKNGYVTKELKGVRLSALESEPQ